MQIKNAKALLNDWNWNNDAAPVC